MSSAWISRDHGIRCFALLSLFGKNVVLQRVQAVKAHMSQYIAYPPIHCRFVDNENRAVAPAGPIARTMLTTVCASPFTEPKRFGEGAELVTNMKEQPSRQSIG